MLSVELTMTVHRRALRFRCVGAASVLGLGSAAAKSIAPSVMARDGGAATVSYSCNFAGVYAGPVWC